MDKTALSIAALATLTPLSVASAQPYVVAVDTARSSLVAEPSGEEPSPRDRARVKVEQGTSLYEKGEYEQALAAFQDAASLYASPDFQFNIGLCHERLGNYTAAISAFETYLRNKPDAPDRVAVEGRIRDIKERQELEQRAAAAAAADAEKKKDPPPETTPPETTPPETTPEESTDGDDEEPDEVGDGRGLVIGGGVLLGIGVLAAAGGGTAFGVLAGSPSRSVDAVLNQGNPQGLTLAETRDLAEEADRHRTGQIVSLAAGGVLATTGLVMLVVGLKRRRPVDDTSARVAPAITRDFAGLTLRGRF